MHISSKNLIFDVGMHEGEDTDFYLKKGFKVIAFEANPHLAEKCRSRFAHEIQNDKLVIIEGAIIDKNIYSQETINFYLNEQRSVWGTVMDTWAKRNEKLGTSNNIIKVKTIDFAACLKRYGIPYYLKIDIEGMDMVCLNALKDFDHKPDYISIESNIEEYSGIKNEIACLVENGYDSFKIINQSDITRYKEPVDSCEGRFINYSFIAGSSGLFGKDLPNQWHNKNTTLLKYRIVFLIYKLFGYKSPYSKYRIVTYLRRILEKIFNTSLPGWRDTHARHSSVKINLYKN